MGGPPPNDNRGFEVFLFFVYPTPPDPFGPAQTGRNDLQLLCFLFKLLIVSPFSITSGTSADFTLIFAFFVCGVLASF